MRHGGGHSPRTVRKPPRLRPGDVIGLICPASAPVSGERIEGGVRYLEGLGYRVELGRHVHARHGAFAGTDAQRVEDLNDMIRNPGVKAIIAVRGGYGCARLLDRVDYAAARRHPKILVGYSDLTALQMALWCRAGWVTCSGPMAGVEFWQGPDPFTESLFWRLLTSPEPVGDLPFPANGKPGRPGPGQGEGRLLGGCLSLLTSVLATPYQPDFRGGVLVLEDVHEASHRLDRMFTQLRLAGILPSLSALALGHFTERGNEDPGPGASGLPWSRALEELLSAPGLAGLPCLTDVPYGHVPVKWTLPWGIRARLDADQGTLALLEGAVC